MKGTKIDFMWIDKGWSYKRVLDRKEMFSVFNGLVNGFEGDNEISKKFVNEIIPFADTILINADINNTQDVPGVYYSIDGDSKYLKIIRYHKIIWAILNKYCTK